jgi:hypothetical protein
MLFDHRHAVIIAGACAATQLNAPIAGITWHQAVVFRVSGCIFGMTHCISCNEQAAKHWYVNLSKKLPGGLS